MKFNYAEIAADVDLMIYEAGQSMTLKVSSGAAYDPETGSSVVTYTDQSATGCTDEFEKKLIDGTKIRIGDKLVWLSPIGISEPKDGDQLVIGSDTWQVVPPVSVISPAGIACLYGVQVRK